MWYGTSLVCCCSQHSSITVNKLCDGWQPLLPSIIITVNIVIITIITVIITVNIIITIVITTKEQST